MNPLRANNECKYREGEWSRPLNTVTILQLIQLQFYCVLLHYCVPSRLARVHDQVSKTSDELSCGRHSLTDLEWFCANTRQTTKSTLQYNLPVYSCSTVATVQCERGPYRSHFVTLSCFPGITRRVKKWRMLFYYLRSGTVLTIILM